MTTPTVYEWADGAPAFKRRFYDQVEQNEPLAPLFPGGVSREHREHVAEWWCEVMGGPAVYTEQQGATSTCSRDTAAWTSPQEAPALLTLLSTAADRAGSPMDPEFRAAIMSYAEWGLAGGAGQLEAGRGGRPARARPPLGLGRRASLPTLTHSLGALPDARLAESGGALVLKAGGVRCPLGVSDEFVGEDRDPVTDGLCVDEAHGLLVAGLAEEARAGTEDDGVDH
jgi:hemoglobin